MKSTSLSPSERNMRSRSEDSDKIEHVHGCSASLVSVEPTDRKRILAQLEDVVAGSGQVPGLALKKEEIVGKEVNVVEDEREKEAGQGNEH